MSMLHTVNKSPFERNTLESCLRLATDGSAVLLMEDGVYAALAGTAKSGMVESHTSSLKFYVLEADLTARGLNEKPLIDGVKTVDYSGFVDLVTNNDASQAWL